MFLNDNSPATYVNTDRFSTTPVPAGVDPAATPTWRQVSTERVWRWHDHRMHWMLRSLPPVVVSDPTVPHRISEWSVVLDHGGERLIATGTLDWVPGPAAWPWFVAMALLAAGVAAAAYVRPAHRSLAAATALLVMVDVVHGLGAMLATVGTVPERLAALFGPDALLIWPFALLATWLLWRGHTRAVWLAASVGLILSANATIDDAPLLWRSSAPSLLPAVVDRACVATVLGIGLGLVAGLPVLLRSHHPEPRPWRQLPVTPGLAAPAEPAPAGGEGRIGRRQVTGYLAAGALGALAGSAAALAGGRTTTPQIAAVTPLSDVGARSVPFHGPHQAGIVTPARPQASVWVGAFDLEAGADAEALRELLRRWTAAGAKLTAGEALGDPEDTVTADLGPAALTVTVGFGPSLFGKSGVPATARPEALASFPAFAGEHLDPVRSDGDLGVVVASHDEVVVAHTVRTLRRLAAGVARSRWQMTGFNSARGVASDTATPRNLMGQVDGTNNPRATDPDFATKVFASEPDWLRGGSYLVVRRIRMLLDDWDGLSLVDQERVIGRRKDGGAPLSGGDERTPANFSARNPDGSLTIPADAHMRIAAPAFNQGAAMLRRGFSYVDGDEAGLVFLAWQADPRKGFIAVQRRLVEADALARFIRHETSALFAMPGGIASGSYIGESLLEAT